MPTFTFAGLINTSQFFDTFGKLLKSTALTITVHGSMTLANLYATRTKVPTVTQPVSTDASGDFATGNLFTDPGDYDVWRGGFYIGSFHVSPDNAEFSGAAGPPGPTLTPRGAYSGATTYAAFDQVTWSASGPVGSYYAKSAPPVGTDPSNTTYWAKIADPGAQGIQGIQGVVGPPGVNWRTDSLTILPSTAYALNDGLQDSSGSWRCILAYTSAASPVVPSADPTHWAFVALQGPTGGTGAAGGAGPTGPPGVNWRAPSTIQPSTAYALNDGLQDAGGSWRCILAYTSAASPVVPSADNTHWAFVALQGNVGATGGTGATGSPGAGTWRSPLSIQPNTSYALNDMLQDGGGSWRCILAYTTGTTPTAPSADGSHWAYVALVGPAGAVGSTGPQGAAGAGAELVAPAELTANAAGITLGTGLGAQINGTFQITFTMPSGAAIVKLKLPAVQFSATGLCAFLFLTPDGTTELDRSVIVPVATLASFYGAGMAEVRLPNSVLAPTAGTSVTIKAYLSVPSGGTATVLGSANFRPRLTALAA